MTPVAISIEGLGKRYELGQISTGTFFRDFERWWARRRGRPDPYARIGETARGDRHGTLWALRDVDLEIAQGEVLGIVGRNGAGKSTLLKILSRVTAPTCGVVRVRGRIASLLEVGTGFHPELTGRENVFLNGTILGMTRAEVRRKFDEIVDFSGVETFIDTPVKRYSSGMYVRLAFAVAAHLEPEILVVDEVLAVGDVGFQEKCLGKMDGVARSGRTVLFVSHNLSTIWSLCPHSIWLDKGLVAARGRSEDVINAYRNAMRAELNAARGEIVARPGDEAGSRRVRVKSLALLDADGRRCEAIASGDGGTFVVGYEAARDVRLDDLMIQLIVTNDRQARVFTLTNVVSGDRFTDLPWRGQLRCHVPELPLIPGEYDVTVSCKLGAELAHKVRSAGRFAVTEGDFFGTGQVLERNYGDVLLRHRWSATPDDLDGRLVPTPAIAARKQLTEEAP